jgi:Enhancer of polycomb-like
VSLLSRSNTIWMNKVCVHHRVGVMCMGSTRHIDQEWLDALNAERKKEQLGKISYEAFEIVMDRLEKEWFDLVCDDAPSISALTHVGRRRRTYRNPTWHCHPKTQLAQFVTIQKERILTPSCSVMGVI